MPGTGEINEDPYLVAPDAGDYSLMDRSPCIDAGNPDPLFDDPDGTRNDMGALYHDQAPTSVASESGSLRPSTWGRVKTLYR